MDSSGCWIVFEREASWAWKFIADVSSPIAAESSAYIKRETLKNDWNRQNIDWLTISFLIYSKDVAFIGEETPSTKLQSSGSLYTSEKIHYFLMIY